MSLGLTRARQSLPASRLSAGLVALLVAALGLPLLASPASAADAGHVDFNYALTAGGPDKVTSYHSQNKLWFNDGRWWAVMWRPNAAKDAGKWTINRLDTATQSWVDTTVEVDQRDKSSMDVLWDNTAKKLYVASSNDNTATQPIQVHRFTYNTSTRTYASGGAPAVTSALGVSFASIAKDSAGKLFIAYTSANKVQYMTSSDGVAWSAPAQVPTAANAPTAGAPGATSPNDDVAALTRVGNSVGVMWSRTSSDTRIDGGFFFSVFNGTTWSATAQAAWAGDWIGDNHVSVKTAADGRVIAAVKSSLNSGGGGPGSAPLIAVLERSVAGIWSNPSNAPTRKLNVSSVAQLGTRPMLVLDEGAKEANVFLTNPADPTMPTKGGDINRRTAPLSTLNFGTPSLGSAYIKSSANPGINDATSTKQGLNDTSSTRGSGLVVLASDEVKKNYLHGFTAPPVMVPLGSRFKAEEPAKPVATGTLLRKGTFTTVSLPSAPADANAVALNVAATSVSANSNVNVCPGNMSSTDCKLQVVLRAVKGNRSAGFTVTSLYNKTIRLYSSAGDVTVNIEVQGWYVQDVSQDHFRGFSVGHRLSTDRQLGAFGYKVAVPSNLAPAGTNSVVLTVTAHSATTSTAVYVCGGDSADAASCKANRSPNLNPTKAVSATTQVIAPLGADGTVRVVNSSGSVRIRVDIVGRFGGGEASAYRTSPRARLSTLRPMTSGGTYTLAIPGLPTGAESVVLRVSGSSATTKSRLSVCSANSSTTACRATSVLGILPGWYSTNIVVVRLSPDGKVKFYNSAGSNRLTVDVVASYSH